MSYDLKNKSVSYLKLDVSPDYYGDYKKVVMAKQGDVYTRFLKVAVYENSRPIDVTQYTATLNIKKPSGGVFVTHGEIEQIEQTEDDSESQKYKCIYFKIFKNMLDEIGHVTCDVSLYQKTDSISIATDGGIYRTSVTLAEPKPSRVV